MAIDEETHVVLENTCKESPGCSASLMDWNLFSGQSEAGNSNASVRESAQGPIAWNARNSYGYTYVYS